MTGQRFKEHDMLVSSRLSSRPGARLLLALLLLAAAPLAGCDDDSAPPAADAGIDTVGPAADGAASDSAPALDGAPADAASADAPAADAALDALVPDAVVRPDTFQQPLPTLGSPTMFVNLGDSIAAGYGVPSTECYRALLLQNDDATYPGFTGKDLETKFPSIQLVDRSYPGATSKNLDSQLSGVPANPSGDTLVVVSVGGNDIMNDYFALADPAHMQAVVTRVEANVDKVLAHFADKSRYPGKTTVVLFNVYDFTDGMGSIPKDAQVDQYCGTLKALGPLVGQAALKSFAIYNQEIAKYAQASNLLLLDIHAHFLGHGFNYKEPQSLYYVPSDPTLWFQPDCIHPNVRGHHEIRRLLWAVLFGP